MTYLIEPFPIQIPQVQLDDLAQRLAQTRWPDQQSGTTARATARAGRALA